MLAVIGAIVSAATSRGKHGGGGGGGHGHGHGPTKTIIIKSGKIYIFLRKKIDKSLVQFFHSNVLI